MVLWTQGPGLAKWRASPTPWRTLRSHLIKYVPASYVDRVVSQWFHDATGIWPAERKGDNPLGKG